MISKLKTQIKRYRRWYNYYTPVSLSATGWRLYEKEFQQKAPVRYFLSKNLNLNFLRPVTTFYENAVDWARLRTIAKFHTVKTGLKPGYYEVEKILLHSSFNLLKDFVEVELSWSQKAWEGPKIRFPRIQKYFHRDAEAALSHLKWAAGLDDPALPIQQQNHRQAAAAREILALYDWWVNVRPARKEEELPIYNDQGLGILAVLDDDFDQDAADYKSFQELMEHNRDLREKWEEEDTEMLTRLVKVRTHLWT
jgi:hypothetical protein